MSDDYQKEMDALVERSRPRAQITLPYTEMSPFPVKAGPGRIVKGRLVRLPEPRTYAAGQSVADSIGAAVVFNNVTRFANNGSGVIIGGKLAKNSDVIINTSFRIWLYQTPFMLNAQNEDGSPFAIRWGRRDDRIGYLDFENFVSGIACAEAQAMIGVGQSLLFGMNQGNSLYGLVQTRGPYIAMPSEQMDFYLHVAQD